MTTKKKTRYIYLHPPPDFFFWQNAFQMLNTEKFEAYIAIFLERKEIFRWEEQIRQPQTKAIWPWK
jgi:hypothetical protein